MERKFAFCRNILKKCMLMACAVAAMAVPAQAADCTASHLEFASLDMTPLPGGAGVSVPVTVNGQTLHFLVATGAGTTTLTQGAGETLGIPQTGTSWPQLLDANGFVSYHYFTTQSVGFGTRQIRDLHLVATPDGNFGQDPALDGVLAADLMSYSDIEMDFVQHKLNIFYQGHCPGQVVYWPATTIGVAPIKLAQRSQDQARMSTGGYHIGPVIGVASTPGSVGDTNALIQSQNMDSFDPQVRGVDIRTTVLLDGKSFTANIDTGSPRSTLNTATARAVYDVTENSPGSAPLTAPAQVQTAGVSETVVVNGMRVFVHTFHTLTLGDVTVTNPRFTVCPSTGGTHDRSNGIVTGSLVTRVDDIPQPEITIGMDILSQFHLYFAFKEGKLYLTSNSPPPATHT